MKILRWISLSIIFHLALSSILIWRGLVPVQNHPQEHYVDMTLVKPSAPSTQKISSLSLKDSLKNELPANNTEDLAEVTPTPQSNLSLDNNLNAASWADITTPPQLRKEVKIPYPGEAKAHGVEGAVLMEILIDSKGLVQEVHCISGPGYGLNEAAVNAIKNFEFAPAQIDTKPVAVKIRYSYKFKLNVN